jgi:hypothetical protein
MDTDAAKFSYENFNKWNKIVGSKVVPHWEEVEKYDERYKTHKIYEENSKVFGSYENELKDNNLSYIAQKKAYLICNTETGYKKMSFKGINEKGLYLNEDEAKLLINKSNKELWYYYIENKNKKLDNLNTCIEFFKNLCNNQICYVLMNVFKKNVKNNKHHVEINQKDKFNKDNNTISVNFIIKKIKLNN